MRVRSAIAVLLAVALVMLGEARADDPDLRDDESWPPPEPAIHASEAPTPAGPDPADSERLALARRELERALTLDPSTVACLNTYAVVLERSGQQNGDRGSPTRSRPDRKRVSWSPT